MRHERRDNRRDALQKDAKQTTKRPTAGRPITGVRGEWVKVSDRYINCDNIAFVEEAEGGAWLLVYMLRDRADRQQLPVRNEKPWRRKTQKFYLMGEDAQIMRKWLRSRSVLLVLPKAKDPDEF